MNGSSEAGTDDTRSGTGRPTVPRGVWVVGAVLAGALFVDAFGLGRFRSAVLAADVGTVAVVVGVALLVLVLRGVALGVLLDVLGYSVPTHRIVSVYAVTTAISTVVPGGQAGGAPVNGHVVARAADADYEDGVAAVVVASLLSNLAVVAFGLCGAVYHVATAPGGTGVGAIALGLIGAVAVGTAGLWRARGRVYSRIVAVAVRLARIAGRLPRVPSPDPEAVRCRSGDLVDAVGRLREGTPRQVGIVGGLFAVAHVLTVLALGLSLTAVDLTVPAGVLLAVIPVAVVGAAVPVPGGVGGVDVALVGLLSAGTAATAPVAGAAVAVYRTASSGPALLIGGPLILAMTVLGWFSGADGDAA